MRLLLLMLWRSGKLFVRHWYVVNVRDGATFRGKDCKVEKDKCRLHQQVYRNVQVARTKEVVDETKGEGD